MKLFAQLSSYSVEPLELQCNMMKIMSFRYKDKDKMAKHCTYVGSVQYSNIYKRS